jgi:hypothetical protein
MKRRFIALMATLLILAAALYAVAIESFVQAVQVNQEAP